jgi:hypothetical protein
MFTFSNKINYLYITFLNFVHKINILFPIILISMHFNAIKKSFFNKIHLIINYFLIIDLNNLPFLRFKLSFLRIFF